jgi:anti-sigma factor ChrR (cupin superfamily)
MYHTIDSRVHKRWSDAWTWHCPQRSEVAFLTAIIPHLRGKKEQAEAILRFIALKRSFKRTHVGSGGFHSLKGSLPLGDGEIFARTQLWNEVRGLNLKGQYSRKLKGGDAHAAH